MNTCQYDATGEFLCTKAVEKFHSRSDDPNSPSNPDNYPACINTGCSAGKPCTNASGCLNGLACPNGVCVIPKGTVFVGEHEEPRRREEPHHKEIEHEEDSRPWWTWWMWWR